MGFHPQFDPGRETVLPAVTRLDAGSILGKLQACGLLAQGRAHVVSVEAIRDAFGARWPLRKEVVWDMAEAQLLKRVGNQAFAARLSDAEFIIITPKMEPDASQTLAARVSRQLLDHFLGESTDTQISIKVVTEFADQAVICRALTPSELTAALASSLSSKGVGLASETPAPQAQAPEDEVKLTTVNGTTLRFSTSVNPIIDLSRWAVAGHRIEPKIVCGSTRTPLSADERRKLLPLDVASVDRATLKKALQRLEPHDADGRRSTLIVTVSFLTVSSSWAFAELVSLIDERAKIAMSGSVIWEVADFEAGVPAGRLLDCFSALSPYARAVFVRAEKPTLTAISERSLGRCGLIFQPPGSFLDEDEAAAWLMGLSRAVSKRSATLVAANLPSKDLLLLARTVGFTHATMRPVVRAA